MYSIKCSTAPLVSIYWRPHHCNTQNYLQTLSKHLPRGKSAYLRMNGPTVVHLSMLFDKHFRIHLLSFYSRNIYWGIYTVCCSKSSKTWIFFPFLFPFYRIYNDKEEMGNNKFINWRISRGKSSQKWGRQGRMTELF